MPEYSYIADDAEGKPVRGTLEANDHQDLVARLSEHGLFLVSATEAAPPTARLPEVVSPDTGPGFHRLQTRLAWEALGIVILLILYFWPSEPWPAFVPSPEVTRKTEKIRVGMTRGEVEQSLARYGDGRSTTLTRYMDYKQALIDVPYNHEGGEWSAQNRVTGPPQVYTEFKAVGWHLEPK